MENIITPFSHTLQYAHGWMVIHSLWQAMAIALMTGILMLLLRKKSAQVRYIVGNIALFAVLVSAVSTFTYYYQSEKNAQATVLNGLTISSNDNAALGENKILTVNKIPDPQNAGKDLTIIVTEPKEDNAPNNNQLLEAGGLFKDYFNKNIPLILTIWVLGMALFLLKIMGSISYIYIIRNRHNFPVDEYWLEKLMELKDKLKLQKGIELVESALVRSPVVVGHLKPVILFPIGVINRLSPQDVEAILAHELAHIARHDYIFNILQSLVEALFYYHPAVWWLSAQVRTERESACDEIAIDLINSKMNYAKALITIQEMAYYPLSPALGFAGQRKNQFLIRMQRILNQPQNKTNVMEKLIATLLIFVTLVGLSIGQNQNEKQQNTNDTPQYSTPQTPETPTPSSFQNITTIGDTTKNPFYTVIPPTPEIIKLQKELAVMEREFPTFEKEKEAEIEKLKQELAEMEKGITVFEKDKETEIAALEKEASTMKGDLPKAEKEKEVKIEKMLKDIKVKEAELEVFTKKIEEENSKIEAQIVEKKKERDGQTTVKRSRIDGDIQGLYGTIQGNLGDIQGKRGEIQGMYGEVQGLRSEISGDRGELQGKFGEIQGKRGEIMGKRGEIQGKRGEIQGARGEIMGKRGEIQGKHGEIQGKYTELLYKTLIADLKKDKIITDDSRLLMRLNNKEMFVNNIKQSDAIHAQYKAKYLKGNNRGFEIYKRNGNLNFSMDDDEN